jgi:hypothetical protein
MVDDLPDWMQEKDDSPNTPPDDLESLLGELDNLHQVIRLESISKGEFTPPLTNDFVQVSDRERLRALLFGSLVESESFQKPVQIPKRIVPYPALRILTVFTILSAVLFPQFLPIHRMIFPPPQVSNHILQAYQLIRDLPSQATVLLAVEFEPGFSGELNAVALPIINQLFNKQTFIAIVSTLPTGPVQAENLMMQSGYRKGLSKALSGSYVNYGYLAGGLVGVQNFVQSPQTVFLTGHEVLDHAAQQKFDQIDSLADLAMIIVVSDRPEVARNWIEQVRPTLENMPLIMVLSAQAGPVIHPYIEAESGQIQGMIVGLADGVAFESIVGQSSIPAVNWFSYNFGLVVTIILVACAAAWYLVSVNFKDRATSN